MKYVPHPYQEYGHQFLMDHPEACMFLDMGLGKTSITLSAVADLVAGLEIRSALVVAPIRVCESVWPAEAEKWEHLRWLRLELIRGNLRERSAALERPADIYLINYENLAWLAGKLSDRGVAPPWDMLIFDESTKMKSSSSKRFKKFKPWLRRASRRVILTGTPTPNSYLDLWAQLYCTDVGTRLGEYVTHYRDRWFEHNQWTRETTIRPGSAKKIRESIKDITLCLRSEDLLRLPPIIENTIHVELPKGVRAMYEKFEADMIVKLTEEKEVEALTAAALSMKCRQLTSGAVYDPPVLDKEGNAVGQRTWTEVHEAKLEALDDVIEEANGESVLVVYEFKHELARLLKRYPKAPWIGGGSQDSDGCIAKWNEKKFPVMFVHAASVGHGVNLQHGGRIMVWTSMSWSYELYAQMVKRLHRQGQADKVMIHRLVCKDTVDEVVAEVLDGKRTGQNALLAALRARLVGRAATYAPGKRSKRKPNPVGDI